MTKGKPRGLIQRSGVRYRIRQIAPDNSPAPNAFGAGNFESKRAWSRQGRPNASPCDCAPTDQFNLESAPGFVINQLARIMWIWRRHRPLSPTRPQMASPKPSFPNPVKTFVHVHVLSCNSR